MITFAGVKDNGKLSTSAELSQTGAKPKSWPARPRGPKSDPVNPKNLLGLVSENIILQFSDFACTAMMQKYLCLLFIYCLVAP